MKVSNSFFPSKRTFWFYHCLGLLAIASIDSFTILFAPQMAGFKVWSSWVLWPPLFTLAVLGFRWIYLKHELSNKRIGKLIPIIVVYASLTGALAATCITGILLPFFWQGLVPPEIAATGDVNLVKLGFPIIIGAALSGQLFIIAWAFIYVSIIQNRKAREQELTNARLQISLKDAQLATLQNQLNPHFLFNALNNIRFVIYENAETADRMLTALSELLRYSLSYTDKAQVSLKQELTMTQRFIDLEKLQYEEKLKFDLQIQLDDQQLVVPPMSVQSLVENAIKHGLEYLPEGGIIAVDIRSSANNKNFWEITVINPIPDPKKNKMNKSPKSETGLNNIRTRIQLLFGTEAKLETEQTSSNFVAKLTLPRETQV